MKNEKLKLVLCVMAAPVVAWFLCGVLSGCANKQKDLAQVTVVQGPTVAGVLYPIAKADNAADRVIINGEEVVRKGAPAQAPISQTIVADGKVIKLNLKDAGARLDVVEGKLNWYTENYTTISNENGVLARANGQLQGDVSKLQGRLLLCYCGFAVAGLIIAALVYLLFKP